MALCQCPGNPVSCFMKAIFPVTSKANPYLGKSARQDVLGLCGIFQGAGKVRIRLVSPVDERKDNSQKGLEQGSQTLVRSGQSEPTVVVSRANRIVKLSKIVGANDQA